MTVKEDTFAVLIKAYFKGPNYYMPSRMVSSLTGRSTEITGLWLNKLKNEGVLDRKRRKYRISKQFFKMVKSDGVNAFLKYLNVKSDWYKGRNRGVKDGVSESS